VVCLIDALDDILLAFPAGDRFAHFTLSGKPPLRTTLPNYTPTIDRHFYIWGLNRCMDTLSNLTDSSLPPTDEMATTVTDSLNYHPNATKGRTILHTLHSSLTAAGIEASSFPTKAPLATDGPDGVGVITMGNEDATFTDTRKVVISLTSTLSLLYATALQKLTIHLMPDPINPRFLRIYRVPQQTLGEGEVLPPKPIPHTQAAINRTDLARQLRGPPADYTSRKNHARRDITTLRDATKSSSRRWLSTPRERVFWVARPKSTPRSIAHPTSPVP
jgi:hypothetical protein